MLRFSEMEQQARFDLTDPSTNQDTTTKPNIDLKRRRPSARGRPARGRGRGLNRAAKLVKVGRRRRFPWRIGRARAQIARRESPRKRKFKILNQHRDASTDKDDEKSSKTSHKFLDFKPEILESRTRNNITDINSVEKSSVVETPSVPQNEPVHPKYGERGRNSVRKRMPYHKNARYELEIEKEEAKLVERKRKRIVSYNGSTSGADTTDDSPVAAIQPVKQSPVAAIQTVKRSPVAASQPDKQSPVAASQPDKQSPVAASQPDKQPPISTSEPDKQSPVAASQQPVKRKRGRPRKTEAQKAFAAKSRQIRVKYQGVGRGKYPRIKKTMPKKVSKVQDGNEQSNNENDVSSFIKGDLQRSIQVVMDPDNHTKMKFVSLKPNAKKMAVQTSRKRKKKTKHLGPVSPSQRENVDNCIMSCGDGNDSKMTKNNNIEDTLGDIQIKQEPHDPGYETSPVPDQPPPIQIVRPDPPPDLKKLICNKKLGETVLHRACRMARDDVAIYCIDYQMCDINAKDNAGYTPLHECCVNGRIQVAEHLLRHGADVNASATDGTRPIHDAVDNHRMDILRLLLAYGADPLEQTYSGRTAFKLARTQQMRSFIIGYLRDVNGEWELDDEEYPEYVNCFKDTDWRFPDSSVISSDYKSKTDGVGVFDEIPTLDPPNEDNIHDDDDFMFEMSETPHVQTYNLQLAGDNGPRNWLLLADVRKALGGKLDDVINTCEDVEPITITRREFNYALREGLASLPTDMPPKVHGHVSDSETVELVELNDSIRQALDIDTEFVR